MNGVQAARAVDLVQARVAIPIHWGTYHPMLLYRAMAGMWREPADTLRDAAVRNENVVDVRVLDVGAGTVVTERDVSGS
jgi:L-ascorbate metabolism protein UlaG (beta-lactamase superfamily)